ncbi:MAG: dihydrofolate reductase [Rhodothermales bacterium]|jgi:dihydrofolate reductase
MSKPEIVIVAAVGAENRVMGKGLELPWHIPEDLKHFKRLTLGHPMLMGRRTFQSLVEQFGGPLKGRRHLVVTRNPDYTSVQAEVFSSPDEALAAAGDVDLLIIAGGATIYEQFLERADRMELTLVDGEYDGDVFFPEYEHLIGTRYRITRNEPRDGFRFMTYEVR